MTPRLAATLIALSALAALGLGMLMAMDPLDGEVRSDLLQFCGRFHPVLLHLPIGFIVLLGVLELARLRQRFAFLRASIGLVLTLAVLSTLVATGTGFLLAYASGANEPLVQEHFRAGAGLAISCLLLGILGLAGAINSPRAAWVACYRIVLVVTLALLTVASHRGGSITHGRDYLTRHMPAGLRTLLGVKPAALSTASAGTRHDSVYHELVRPVLEQNCLSCHNADKRKGRLVLDSFAGLLAGGESGPALVPGNAGMSELFRRVTLPPDDEKFMPSEGKPPLKNDEVALLRWWIATGGSEQTRLADFASVPPAVEKLAAQARQGQLSPADLARLSAQRQKLNAIAAQLNRELGIRLLPESADAQGYTLDAFTVRKTFDDTMLRRLAPVAAEVVEANLSGTALTDRSLTELSKFRKLRTLNLSRTAVSGENLGLLAGLPELESLNLYGTPLSTQAVGSLAKLKQLKRLYVFDTLLSRPPHFDQLRATLPRCEVIAADVFPQRQEILVDARQQSPALGGHAGGGK